MWEACKSYISTDEAKYVYGGVLRNTEKVFGEQNTHCKEIK